MFFFIFMPVFLSIYFFSTFLVLLQHIQRDHDMETIYVLRFHHDTYTLVLVGRSLLYCSISHTPTSKRPSILLEGFLFYSVIKICSKTL